MLSAAIWVVDTAVDDCLGAIGGTVVYTHDDKILIIVKRRIEVPQKHCAQSIVVVAVRNRLNADEAVALLGAKAVEVAARFDLNAGVLKRKMNGFEAIIKFMARLSRNQLLPSILLVRIN